MLDTTNPVTNQETEKEEAVGNGGKTEKGGRRLSGSCLGSRGPSRLSMKSLGAEEALEVANLYQIEHRICETIVVNGMLVRPQRMPGLVPSIPCTDPDCVRCRTGRGGYQFRWCSWKLMQRYTEFAKQRQTRNPQHEHIQAIWLPGDAEN